MPVTRASDLQFRDLPGRAAANPFPDGVDGCTARVVRIPPGARTPHRHPRTAEIVYVVSGSGVAWEDGTQTQIGPGDLLTIPRGVAHATAAAGEEMVLVCFFPDDDLASNTEELDGPEIEAST